MALIKFIDGKKLEVSHKIAVEMWEILNNEREGSEEQEKYCSKINKIYFNWRKAPDSWIKENLDFVKEKALIEWYCDNQGNPTRPQYDWDWKFAKKWGFLNLIRK